MWFKGVGWEDEMVGEVELNDWSQLWFIPGFMITKKMYVIPLMIMMSPPLGGHNNECLSQSL